MDIYRYIICLPIDIMIIMMIINIMIINIVTIIIVIIINIIIKVIIIARSTEGSSDCQIWPRSPWLLTNSLESDPNSTCMYMYVHMYTVSDM